MATGSSGAGGWRRRRPVLIAAVVAAAALVVVVALAAPTAGKQGRRASGKAGAAASTVTPTVRSGPTIVFTSDQSVILGASGEQYRFAAHAQGTDGKPIRAALRWQSTDPLVVQVAPDGTATAQSDFGSATIRVSAPGVGEQAAQVTVATPAPDTELVPDSAVLRIGRDTVTLNGDDLSRPVRPGDILVSGNRAGLLVKALTVAQSGGAEVTVTTAPATLVDAFPRLSIHAESAPTPITVTYDQFGSATVSFAGAAGTPRSAAGATTATDNEPMFATLDSFTRQAQSTPTTQPPSTTSTTEKPNKPASKCSESGPSFTPSVQLTGPTFTVDATAHLVGLLDSSSQGTHFVLGVQATLPVKLTSGSVQITGTGKMSAKCEWHLKTIRLPSDLFIGPISIMGDISFSAGLDLTGQITASLTLTGPTAADTAYAYDGIEYNSGKGWSSLHNNGQTGVRITPASADFNASLSVDFSPYIQADFGAEAVLGDCDIYSLCGKLVGADLVFVRLAGHLQFDLASPLDDLELGYTGPAWSAGVELTGGPEVKNVSGNVIDIVQRLGLPVPDQQWTLLDLKGTLLSSPVPQVQITGDESPGSKVQLRAQIVAKLAGFINLAGIYNGDTTEFALYPKAGGRGRFIASAKMNNGTASASWTVPAGGLAAYEIGALLQAPPFGSLLPYASDANLPGSPGGSGGGSTPSGHPPSTSDPSNWSPAVTIDAGGGGLSGVSCPTPKFCMAVDGSGRALNFDGNIWSQPTDVTSGSGGLYSVSCPTASFCVAGDQTGDVYAYDGNKWSSPVGLGAVGDLMAVTCTSATSCIASAVESNGTFYRYDGTAWTPDPSFSDDNEKIDIGEYFIADMSCPKTTRCLLVDGGGNSVGYSNGSWGTPESVDPDGGFESVSCPAVTFCAATDFAGNALTYENGSWSAPNSVDPFGSGLGAEFTGGNGSVPYADEFQVVCPSGTSCIGFDGAGYVASFQAGGWSAPVPIDPDGGGLTAMSCPTATFCMAVDFSGSALIYSPQ